MSSLRLLLKNKVGIIIPRILCTTYTYVVSLYLFYESCQKGEKSTDWFVRAGVGTRVL